jgi:hypothetical protein
MNSVLWVPNLNFSSRTRSAYVIVESFRSPLYVGVALADTEI